MVQARIDLVYEQQSTRATDQGDRQGQQSTHAITMTTQRNPSLVPLETNQNSTSFSCKAIGTISREKRNRIQSWLQNSHGVDYLRLARVSQNLVPHVPQ